MTQPPPTPKPQDRMTRMSGALSEALEAQPEYRTGDRCIVFTSDSEWSGICIHGYDDVVEAVTDLFIHMQAMMRSIGKDLDFIGIPNDLSGLEP
jgi:hypothetical protein